MLIPDLGNLEKTMTTPIPGKEPPDLIQMMVQNGHVPLKDGERAKCEVCDDNPVSDVVSNNLDTGGILEAYTFVCSDPVCREAAEGASCPRCGKDGCGGTPH